MRLLNNVSKIILTFTLFFMSSIFASTYNLNINLINLIIAMFCIITFNSFNSNHYIRIFQILLASILILTSVLFNMKSYNVWFFTIFILSTILINHKKDITINSKALIFIAIFFNLNIISNTNYADIQYDFASNLNYIQYILENNFIFWQENPILTRPSYSTYHPILHYFIFALITNFAILSTLIWWWAILPIN